MARHLACIGDCCCVEILVLRVYRPMVIVCRWVVIWFGMWGVFAWGLFMLGVFCEFVGFRGWWVVTV